MDIGACYAKKFFATRIGGENFTNENQTYKFEKIKCAKREALAKFPNRILIDMGVGEPDKMPCNASIEALAYESKKYENRGYADNGCIEFKKAAAKYMQEQFAVSLDPHCEIVHSIGTKSALSLLPYCFVNPGDVIFTTIPGYPIFGTHSKYLLADVIGLPLYAKNDYLPDLKIISPELWQRIKVLVVNYPNNPTGACATRAFFQQLVELAHIHSFLIINDAAYLPLTFDQKDKISIFNVDGAKNVALELHSMSKGFNMAGWRIGWVCGNKHLIDAYAHVKDQSDSGQFLAIQKAAAQTLANDMFFTGQNSERYSARMDAIVPILRDSGFEVVVPRAGFFLYTHAPSSVEFNGVNKHFLSAEEFTGWMIKELGIVSVPWDDVEASVRFSMTFGQKNIDDNEIIQLFRERMSSVLFRFKNTK